MHFLDDLFISARQTKCSLIVFFFFFFFANRTYVVHSLDGAYTTGHDACAQCIELE